jgi:hypothetical protein
MSYKDRNACVRCPVTVSWNLIIYHHIWFTHQCGKKSLTLIAELLYLSILVMAEIAFSVGLIFSGERDSGSVIISTRRGMASLQAPSRENHQYITIITHLILNVYLNTIHIHLFQSFCSAACCCTLELSFCKPQILNLSALFPLITSSLSNHQ